MERVLAAGRVMDMQTLPDIQTVRRMAAKEAVECLKLLKPGAIPTVTLLLEDAQHLHPKAICAAYRARGAQITDDEKKAFKIRGNASMSYKALDEIYDAGLGNPIHAHETTLLRAAFVMFRYHNASSIERMMIEHPDHPPEIQYDMVHPDACAVCSALHRKPVPPDWGIFPPGGCSCTTAPYGLHVHIDYIGVQLAKEAAQRNVFEKVKRLFR